MPNKHFSPAWMQVEMYADPGARGGVLEPEGIVEIKFRTPDLIKAMHRLDPVISELKREALAGMETSIKAREALLLPVYRQVSCPICLYHSYSGYPWSAYVCTTRDVALWSL